MDGLRNRVEAELTADIFPFWLKYSIDDKYGGFRGQVANDLTIDRRAAKGLILNARILWTFSKAFGVYRDPAYLAAARRAEDARREESFEKARQAREGEESVERSIGLEAILRCLWPCCFTFCLAACLSTVSCALAWRSRL